MYGEVAVEPSVDAQPVEARRAIEVDAARCRSGAFTVVYWQVAVTVCAAILAGVVASWGGSWDGWFESAWRSAGSALAGGGVCVIASAYMARRMFKVPAQAPAAMVVRAFYIGEVAKIGISVALFALAIIYIDLNIPAFLLTYIAALSTYWFALLTSEVIVGAASRSPSSATPINPPLNPPGDAQDRGHR